MRKADPFEERPRKVHYFVDQKGAKIPHSSKPFANTLCKMNSNVPGSHITTIPYEVTCKLCRQHNSFKHILNAQYGKLYPPQVEPIAKATSEGLYVQQIGRGLRPRSASGLRIRYRLGWFGKIIVQVAEEVPYNYDPATDAEPGGYTTRWRDATLRDVATGFGE